MPAALLLFTVPRMNRDGYGAPLLIRDSQTFALKRVPVGLPGEGYRYDEDFIRNLAFNVPSCLPIAEMDSAFRDPVPICKELRNSAGFIDALFVTRDGRLIVLEAKLWRNPEARRKVIGQILEVFWPASNQKREIWNSVQQLCPLVLAIWQGFCPLWRTPPLLKEMARGRGTKKGAQHPLGTGERPSPIQ